MRLLAAILGLTAPILACECPQLTVCNLIASPTLFIGDVVDGGISSIREDPWYSNVNHARFKVIENFRGLPPGTRMVDVELGATAGMCAPNPYFSGRTYLVAPFRYQGKFRDARCFHGLDIQTHAEVVQQVRERFAGTLPVNIQGHIAAVREEMLVALLSIGQAKPLAGVKVFTSHLGQVYSAVTNADGRYQLDLPASGIYKVSATAPPYPSVPDVNVSVHPGGCLIQDFAFSPENTISGRLRDAKGNPVRHADVGLLDLDHPAAKSFGHDWFAVAYTEQPDATFRFDRVPIGRYLMMFNPNGPGADLPLESTYYPGSNRRASAKIIEIKSNGVHLTEMDIAVGAPVQFRQVAVHVQFADGAPMKTAVVKCIGSPANPSGISWMIAEVAFKDGWVRLLAPVNRKLRIELKDWHGRDLKKVYAAEFEPGASKITQTFIVTP